MRRLRLAAVMIMSRIVSRRRLRFGGPVSGAYHARCSMRVSASCRWAASMASASISAVVLAKLTSSSSQ